MKKTNISIKAEKNDEKQKYFAICFVNLTERRKFVPDLRHYHKAQRTHTQTIK